MSGCFDLSYEWEARVFTNEITAVCCACLNGEFRYLAEAELKSTVLSCISCGHKQFAHLDWKLPCSFVVCARCFHSCTTCSLSPTQGLIQRSTCGACQSTMVDRFDGAELTSAATPDSRETVLFAGNSQEMCGNCGYSSRLSKKVDVTAGSSTRNFARLERGERY